MKVKTSITIEEALLKRVDGLVTLRCSRSQFIEDAVYAYLWRRDIEERERRELAILNRAADELNRLQEDL